MKFFFYVFDEDNDDNMRGWDPASEDSNDNGMNRWSENNDEKGWWQMFSQHKKLAG